MFKEKPAFPPNPGQAAILQDGVDTSYIQWIIVLFKNMNFNALVVAFGIMIGGMNTIGTLTNQLILFYYEVLL